MAESTSDALCLPLEVLNLEEDDTFMLLQRGKSQDNLAQREKKRLPRRRTGAAKREREAAKQIVPPAFIKTSAGTKCTSCGRLFKYRKRYFKHGCVRTENLKKESKQNLSGSTGVPPVTGILADSDAPIDLETQAAELFATVEGALGEYLRWVAREKNVREWLVCEVCKYPAVGVKIHGKIHGNHETYEKSCYLKCDVHFRASKPDSYWFPPSLCSALALSDTE
ncbi:hypothetical protein OG21DRAFT_1507277 [Imleria badia]|nr:hypothetical protein OG21DRAFT_1507277 [Imleria badia]